MKSALILLSFLTVTQHESGTRKKMYLGKWPYITKYYPINGIWLIKQNNCRIKQNVINIFSELKSGKFWFSKQTAEQKKIVHILYPRNTQQVELSGSFIRQSLQLNSRHHMLLKLYMLYVLYFVFCTSCYNMLKCQ